MENRKKINRKGMACEFVMKNSKWLNTLNRSIDIKRFVTISSVIIKFVVVNMLNFHVLVIS
jgi:hypothetical protein